MTLNTMSTRDLVSLYNKEAGKRGRRLLSHGTSLDRCELVLRLARLRAEPMPLPHVKKVRPGKRKQHETVIADLLCDVDHYVGLFSGRKITVEAAHRYNAAALKSHGHSLKEVARLARLVLPGVNITENTTRSIERLIRKRARGFEGFRLPDHRPRGVLK